jgi:hypothetical protein
MKGHWWHLRDNDATSPLLLLWGANDPICTCMRMDMECYGGLIDLLNKKDYSKIRKLQAAVALA